MVFSGVIMFQQKHYNRLAVYGSFAIDGLLYSSRLTAAERIAVYDRAVGVRLIASPAVELVRQADLVSVLTWRIDPGETMTR